MLESSSKCQQVTLKTCKCTEDVHQSSYVVDCSNSGLKYFPKEIPAQTTHLYLDYNHLKIVRKNTFKYKMT